MYAVANQGWVIYQVTIGPFRPERVRLDPTLHIESDAIFTTESTVESIYSADRLSQRLSTSPHILLGSPTHIPPKAHPSATMPAPVAQPKTPYDKIWDDHVMYVHRLSPRPTLLCCIIVTWILDIALIAISAETSTKTGRR